jgi:hypothetical protein
MNDEKDVHRPQGTAGRHPGGKLDATQLGRPLRLITTGYADTLISMLTSIVDLFII